MLPWKCGEMSINTGNGTFLKSAPLHIITDFKSAKEEEKRKEEERRKEMFYFKMHSTWFLLHGVGHVVTNHLDSERGNSPSPLHGLLFLIKGARCSSVVRAFAHGAMGLRINPSWGEPIELFLIPTSAPQLV